MKLTIICNFNHGSFASGDRLYTKKEVFGAFLDRKPDEYFEDLSESISLDRDEPVIPDAGKSYCHDFKTSRAIKNRLEFVSW